MPEKTKLTERLCRRFSELRVGRGTWEAHWREAARFIYPSADDFWQEASTSSRGEKKNQQVYDSTAVLSNQQFASLLESLTIPRHQKWHSLTVPDATVMRDRESREWLERTTDTLFRYRYAPSANFQPQLSESFMSIGSFGTGAVFTDAHKGKGLRYKSMFLGDTYFDVNHQGNVDTVYRRFDFSHQQAIQQWGEDGVPEPVLKAAEANPYARSSYLHVVTPNDSMDYKAKGKDGMPFKSCFIHLESQCELETGGYRTMPYAIGRYHTSPHEIYGRGPGMNVLPDIRTLNEMARADLRATHKLVDPPLLVHDDGILGSGRQQIYLDPGMVNFGGVNADGRQLIQPLQTGARVDLNEAKMEVKRQVIKDAFLVSLFQILTQTPRMTATEAMMRAQEKGALMGPIMGRIQSELLSPIVEREIDILMDIGAIGEPPSLLAEALAEGDYDITFESPLSRMQRAEAMVGIDMVIQQAVQLANAGQQDVLQSLDGHEIMRITADGGGAPVSIIKPREQFEAEQQASQEAAAAQMQSESAPQMAMAMKNLAHAEKLQKEAQ